MVVGWWWWVDGQIYLTSKFDSLDTSAILTDHVVVVGSAPTGTLCPIRFQGHGLEMDDKTGGASPWICRSWDFSDC